MRSSISSSGCDAIILVVNVVHVQLFSAFHQKCIDPWLTKNKRTCPLCKKKALPRPGSNTYSDSDDSADDSHVVTQSSERTPLLTTAARQSTAYGKHCCAMIVYDEHCCQSTEHKTPVSLQCTISEVMFTSL